VAVAVAVDEMRLLVAPVAPVAAQAGSPVHKVLQTMVLAVARARKLRVVAVEPEATTLVLQEAL
jgi:hypothetical protein